MLFEISFLEKKDLSDVQDFIDKEWIKNHVLAKSEELFKWQYFNNDKRNNFIISKLNKKIVGVLGFILNNRYDHSLSDEKIIWLSLWKISNEVRNTGIGLKMLSYLKKNIQHKAIFVNGINDNVLNLYKALGYRTGFLNHYYVTNKNLDQKLIKSPNNFCYPIVKRRGNNWIKIDFKNIDSINEKNINYGEFKIFNKKTVNYFLNRYLKHPFYSYKVYLISQNDSETSGLISIRYDIKEDSKVIRIIDFLGDPKILMFSGEGLHNLMNINNVEYTDFWSYGISDQIMKSIGFKLIKKNNKEIVPSYFEPFVSSNISILFAYKFEVENNQRILVFKGDGDQDRPNLI